MDLCGDDDELNQIDETEWIARQQHEMILRKYRQKTQRLVKEFQMKIQQQNRHIRQLTQEVERQKFIIDTFANEPIDASDIHETQQTIVADSTRCVELIEPDLKPTTIIYLDSIDVDNRNRGCQTIKVGNDAVQYPKHYQTARKINTNRHTESTNKKLSLVSIQIQPNLRDSTNVHICDECNKTMSSRRVLAVCITSSCEPCFYDLDLFRSFQTPFFRWIYRNISVWFTVHTRNSFVIIAPKHFAYVMA